MKERATGFRQSRFGFTREGVLLGLLPLLLLVLTAREWAWMPLIITGESMLPTLRGGQLAGVNKLAYLLGPPRRRDIVAVWTGKDLMVKRIVGLPGEEVAARDGTLYVNGSPLREPYAINRHWNVATGKLDVNSFLVVGDNRFQTIVAVVSRERIVGRICLCARSSPNS
ncbi:MAG: signal peptidase I [Limisphaerales bacterium]